MKYKIGKLTFWYLILFFLFAFHADLSASLDFKKAFDWLFKYKSFVSNMTTLISFFAYPFLSYTILYKYYERIPNWLLTLLLLLGVLVGIGFRYLTQELVQKILFGFGNYYGNYSVGYYIWDNIYYALIFTAFGIIFYFIQHSKYKEVQRRELLVENKKTELAFLRSQINPHFLFNVLNNIYTLVYQKSDDSLVAVERLTQLLRYAIYEQEEKVVLQKELQGIDDFIALQKMRYAYPINIQLSIEEGIEETQLAPFVLLPFIENAFKHGNLKEAVKIELKQTKNELIFKCRNHIAQQNKDEQGGVGLENVKRRLELIYGNKHSLDIKNNGKIFDVLLEIPLL